jgi:hypothetical protein
MMWTGGAYPRTDRARWVAVALSALLGPCGPQLFPLLVLPSLFSWEYALFLAVSPFLGILATV